MEVPTASSVRAELHLVTRDESPVERLSGRIRVVGGDDALRDEFVSDIFVCLADVLVLAESQTRCRLLRGDARSALATITVDDRATLRATSTREVQREVGLLRTLDILPRVVGVESLPRLDRLTGIEVD